MKHSLNDDKDASIPQAKTIDRSSAVLGKAALKLPALYDRNMRA